MPSNDRHCPLLILSHLHSFWEKNCNSANSSGQLGNGIASSWQGWFISANTIVLASSRLFRSPWFLSRIFFSKRPTARIHGSGEPAQRLSLWKRISDIETGPQCVVSVLGPFSIHRLITVIFPIVWGVFFRQFSTFGGTRKSLGSGEQRVSCRAAIFQFS